MVELLQLQRYNMETIRTVIAQLGLLIFLMPAEIADSEDSKVKERLSNLLHFSKTHTKPNHVQCICLV